MEVLTCHINIANLQMEWVNTINIESSWEMLTDTASVKLPAKINVSQSTNGNSVSLDNHQISKHIKSGDPVQIQLGYNGDLKTVFKGYVTQIRPRVPIEILCEDEMWKLKQSNIVDSGKKQSLTDLLQKHFSNYKILALDVEIGKYYIDNISGAKFLEALKSDFGLYSFFRGDTLVVGRRYDYENANQHKFKLEYNIIKDDLEFKSADQVKIKVRAISNNSDGTKTEIEIGEQDGDTRTLNFYNLSESELKAAAEREKERLIYDGWRGKFEAFGEPLVNHGDIVELIHATESDKTGRYWVDKVKYKFGVQGFRQEITLGARSTI